MAKVKRPRQLFDLCEVWWDDASALRHGWLEITEELKPQMVLSVGFLIKETEHYIMIAQDTDHQGMHNGRSQIPRGMVKNIKVLRKADVDKEEAIKSRQAEPLEHDIK